MFPNKWNNVDLNLTDFKQFIDIDVTGKRFLLCGNTGDPIYYPDLIPLVQWIKERGGNINLITNGSYCDKSWWEELCGYLDTSDIIQFSMDEVPGSKPVYRINNDWPSVLEGINVVVKSAAKAVWRLIPFKFNEGDLKVCEQLSEELGFYKFHVVPSDRWNEKTSSALKPSAVTLFREARYNNSVPFKPLCVLTHKQHYISSGGMYFPCCYLEEFRSRFKTKFRKFSELVNIKNTTISSILTNTEIQQFYSEVENDRTCQLVCEK